MKKDVKIRAVEEKLWNWFVGHVKQKGLTVSEYLEKHIRKLQKTSK